MIEKTHSNKAVTPGRKKDPKKDPKKDSKKDPKKSAKAVGPSNTKGAAPKKVPPKKVPPKKVPPKKAVVKKATPPKKAVVKKATPPKKAPSKKEPKKVQAKKATPPKAPPKKAPPKATAKKAATKTVNAPKGLQVGNVTFRSTSMFRKMFDNLAGAKGKKIQISEVFAGAEIARDPLRMIRLLAQKGREAGAFEVFQHPDMTISLKKFKQVAAA